MTSQHPMDFVLHHRVRGAGNPVVALHGSASSGAQWRSLVGYLEGRFRVVTSQPVKPSQLPLNVPEFPFNVLDKTLGLNFAQDGPIPVAVPHHGGTNALEMKLSSALALNLVAVVHVLAHLASLFLLVGPGVSLLRY